MVHQWRERTDLSDLALPKHQGLPSLRVGFHLRVLPRRNLEAWLLGQLVKGTANRGLFAADALQASRQSRHSSSIARSELTRIEAI